LTSESTGHARTVGEDASPVAARLATTRAVETIVRGRIRTSGIEARESPAAGGARLGKYLPLGTLPVVAELVLWGDLDALG